MATGRYMQSSEGAEFLTGVSSAIAEQDDAVPSHVGSHMIACSSTV